MTGSFDLSLVALSFVVAVVASYTALELARRVAHADGTAATVWLVTGAASMGIGIWTMHFVGMLAFSMEMPFYYDVPITVLSLLVGMGASAFAIYIGSQENVSNMKIGVSGLILGAGIASMHYSGMAAMKMEATIHYDPLLLGTSIVIAIVAATAAIWIAFTLANAAESNLTKLKTIAAIIMGIAICGMHYTGMYAASYIPIEGVVMDHGNPQQNTWMAVSLGIAALVILGVTHLTIFFDYRLTAERQIGEQAEQKAIRLSEILDDSSNEIYVLDPDTLNFLSVNKGATQNLGYTREQLEQMTPLDFKPDFTREEFDERVQPLLNGNKKTLQYDSVHQRADGTTYPVHVSLQLSTASATPVFVAIIADITERRNLEEQIAQSRKLESIGQLAAGIAHEINTPAQFVGDNTRFLKDAFGDLETLNSAYSTLYEAARKESISSSDIDAVAAAIESADPEYLAEEIPSAIEQSLDGITRISRIVRAMKEFSHPGGEDKELIDLNKNIANTIVVASNEWKYVAKLDVDYDEQLPRIPCHPQEISQVLLNLIVNAAHAIIDKNGEDSTKMGNIRIVTRRREDIAEIRITDTGTGIPDDIRERVFDPFFTTKDVGKGTGQGLSMAYSTIVDKHKGKLTIESKLGVGTTFEICLPVAVANNSSEVVAA